VSERVYWMFALLGCVAGCTIYDDAQKKEAIRNECALRFRAARSLADSLAVLDRQSVCRATLRSPTEQP
jgi:hypothetical protein